jgi:hypothetical protein
VDVCDRAGPFVGVQRAEDEHQDDDVRAPRGDAGGEAVCGSEVPDGRVDRPAGRGGIQRVALHELDGVCRVIVCAELELRVSVCGEEGEYGVSGATPYFDNFHWARIWISCADKFWEFVVKPFSITKKVAGVRLVEIIPVSGRRFVIFCFFPHREQAHFAAFLKTRR